MKNPGDREVDGYSGLRGRRGSRMNQASVMSCGWVPVLFTDTGANGEGPDLNIFFLKL